jgi:acyl-CoA hydrolase
VPGETAAQGCARLAPLLAEHRPGLVLVLLGGNDFLRRLPEQGIRDGLKSCVDVARARAAPIVLIAVPRLGLTGIGNADLHASLGKDLAVPVVDAGLAGLLQRSPMRADRVHLNADGYRALTSAIVLELRKLGFLAN